MSDAWSDVELVQQIATGSREAEDEACRRMAPRIRLYGLRHLRSDSGADDLVQHVLLELIAALRTGRLEDPDKLSSFTLGICRRSVLAMRRAAGRRSQVLAELGPRAKSIDVSPVEIDTERLGRCVQALAERERTVVVFTWYDERSAKETAAFLGTSENNVRVIRHRALRRLRDCMGVEA